MAGLLDLAVAKTHLRITDTDHDADVQEKADAASLAIVGWLDEKADPLWDATTVPPDVRAAMLIMLTHLYEHRGDDMNPTRTGATPDADVWLAVERLMMRRRLPALG